MSPEAGFAVGWAAGIAVTILAVCCRFRWRLNVLTLTRAEVRRAEALAAAANAPDIGTVFAFAFVLTEGIFREAEKGAQLYLKYPDGTKIPIDLAVRAEKSS